jgi:hypothetical protein
MEGFLILYTKLTFEICPFDLGAPNFIYGSFLNLPYNNSDSMKQMANKYSLVVLTE